MAGSSAKGCCAKCGAPWERIIEREGIARNVFPSSTNRREVTNINDARTANSGMSNGSSKTKTLGWQPICLCKSEVGSKKEEVSPCTVLDPFAGSGTTGAVALELGRHAILIELNPKYIELIEQRCNTTAGLALA
jgi:adenine specific DNA methylase Mod